jgi:hypothetical protein
VVRRVAGEGGRDDDPGSSMLAGGEAATPSWPSSCFAPLGRSLGDARRIGARLRGEGPYYARAAAALFDLFGASFFTRFNVAA